MDEFHTPFGKYGNVVADFLEHLRSNILLQKGILLFWVWL